jgi:HD superfamily phosphodiesterase
MEQILSVVYDWLNDCWWVWRAVLAGGLLCIPLLFLSFQQCRTVVAVNNPLMKKLKKLKKKKRGHRGGLGETSVLTPDIQAKVLPMVRERMNSFNDPSHDYAHVLRVRNLALTIGNNTPISFVPNDRNDSNDPNDPNEQDKTRYLRLIELGALFHDFFDWKHTPTIPPPPPPPPPPPQPPSPPSAAVPMVSFEGRLTELPPKCNNDHQQFITLDLTCDPKGINVATHIEAEIQKRVTGKMKEPPLIRQLKQMQTIVEQLDDHLAAKTTEMALAIETIERKNKVEGQDLLTILLELGVEKSDAIIVNKVVSRVGFKKSLSSNPSHHDDANNGAVDVWEERVWGVVSDADRLDAMGWVGIARTFAYAGRKNIPFFDWDVPPREFRSAEEYAQFGRSTVINHFVEKLLILKDGFQTQHGLQMAQKRHATLRRFVNRFLREISHPNHNAIQLYRKHPLTTSRLQK